MNIGLCQTAGAFADVAGNLELMWQHMEQASRAGVDLIVFPELFVTGYHLGERIAELAFPGDGELTGRIAERAAEYRMAVLFGYPEREGSSIFNSAQLVDARGRILSNYRKTHLFGAWEQTVFEPGSTLVSAEVCGFRVGVLICYDVEFPETVRRYACEGVEVVLVPTALMAPYEFVARVLVPARASENQIFLAYANRCGTEGELRYLGLSRICGPEGRTISEADRGPELIVATLAKETLERSRRGGSYLRDRRPVLYGETAPTQTFGLESKRPAGQRSRGGDEK